MKVYTMAQWTRGDPVFVPDPSLQFLLAAICNCKVSSNVGMHAQICLWDWAKVKCKDNSFKILKANANKQWMHEDVQTWAEELWSSSELQNVAGYWADRLMWRGSKDAIFTSKFRVTSPKSQVLSNTIASKKLTHVGLKTYHRRAQFQT